MGEGIRTAAGGKGSVSAQGPAVGDHDARSPYHPDVAALLADYSRLMIPPVRSGTPKEARELLASLRPLKRRAGVREPVDVDREGGRPGLRIYEGDAECRGTILFFHGGGWVLGSLDSCDLAVRTLAADTGCRIVSVDYRLAPEFPFPAAHDDADAAYEWLVGQAERHGDWNPIIVAGDSAGGNLATALALRQAEANPGRIAAQLLVYPVVDCKFDRASYREFAEAVPLGGKDMIWFWDHYCPNASKRAEASPLRAETLSGLPPTFVGLASHDPLLDEGAEYAARLMQAGVATEARLYPGTVHGFFSSPDRLAPARLLIGDIARFLQRLAHEPHAQPVGE